MGAWTAVIIVILVFGFGLFARKRRGAVGESRVARQLRKLADEQHVVFDDLLLNTSRGSSQIDHLVVSIYGIFVIETKNLSGWIHGSEKSEYWTQTIYYDRFRFRNPIKQNWAHVYALKEVLSDNGRLTFHPIVVFAGSAELKNVQTRTSVIYYDQLVRTIQDRCGTPELTIAQVKEISSRLKDAIVLGRKAKREHAYRVQGQASLRRQKEKTLICPKCGGDLVLRDGKYGKFYGCSRYPNCSYTLNYRVQ